MGTPKLATKGILFLGCLCPFVWDHNTKSLWRWYLTNRLWECY